MKTRFNPFAPARVQTPALPPPTRPPAKKPRAARSRVGQAPSPVPAAAAAAALARAQNERSLANYPRILEEFAKRGIPLDEIRPRENVFTYKAWLAQGRVVRQGEHGVKIHTVIPIGEKERVNPDTGAVELTPGTPASPARTTASPARTRPWSATVFHITQTDPLPSRVGQAPSPVPAAAPAAAPRTVRSGPFTTPPPSWRQKYAKAA